MILASRLVAGLLLLWLAVSVFDFYVGRQDGK